MKFLIKPFSEIMVKSKAVKKKFLHTLQNNIFLAFKNNNIDVKVVLFWDKLEVNYIWDISIEKVASIKKILSRIPWIETFVEVEAFVLETENPLHFIFEKARDFYLEKLENKSFVVRVKRTWTHSFSSLEVERYVWWWLLKYTKNAKVNLSNPDIIVSIEIKDEMVFIVKSYNPSIWWYPIWTQQKVLSLISGWFDSGVSTFSIMKRWCKTDFLFFNLWWSAHEIWVKQVSNYLRKNFSAGYRANFITIPFEEVIAELLEKVDARFRAVILKRLFLKIASKLAEQWWYMALVKWDSLWQVSSQTLANMFVIDKASDVLVLRPLISFNKQEIIDLSIKIWTYNFACNMPEYCGVVSDKPATAAKFDDIEKQEAKMDFSILDKALENKKIETIDKVLKNLSENIEIETVFIPAENEIIIDIRLPENIAKFPISIENTEIIKLTFTQINERFENLDKSKKYLLYCDNWVLSQIHASYLQKKWFKNIAIFKSLEKWCNIK